MRLKTWVDKRKPEPVKKIGEKEWINYRPAVKERNTDDFSLKDYFKKKHFLPDIESSYNGREPAQCTHFGCGKILTLYEELCGSVCRRHSGPADIVGKPKNTTV